MKNVVYVFIDTRRNNYTNVLNINNKRPSIRRVALRCDTPTVEISTNRYLHDIKLLDNIQSNVMVESTNKICFELLSGDSNV
jgi:hypothetical protein